MAKGIADATTKIYEQLQPLSPEERLRAVKAALTLLGEPTSDVAPARVKSANGSDKGESDDGVVDGTSEKAAAWIRKNGIDEGALEQMFHIDGGKADLIGDPIGKSKRQQTVNTYILTGLASFIATGIPEFSDDEARGYCQHFGCYDSPNHSNYVKAFGNRITGSKASGWKLTAPGLKAAAALLKPNQGDDE